MGMETMMYASLLVIGAVLFYIYAKTGKMIRCIFFSGTTGLIALGVVWLLGRLMDFTIEFTPFTITLSALLGIPGVVSILVFRLI